MRRYESYKDSGVEWLGEIPSHWEMQRSKFLFKKIERKVKEIDQIVTCFRDGQVTLRANRRTDGFTNALKEHGYQGIRKGDLVIHAMDAFAGAIGVSDSDGKATPVYSVCLPYNKQKVNAYFYAYYLRNLALSGFITSLAKGIRERSTDFRYADFAELLLPLPSYSEQQKITQFLDDKIAKIDQAVDLAEKQIALLKEHKQILIQNAVTRGLNPDVPLKDSGVEWTGQVPEHWEMKKLKFVLTLSNKKEESKNSNKRYIGMENIESFTGKINDIPLIAEGIANSFYKDEILFGKLRPYLAKSYLADFDGICSTEFLVYRSTKVLNNRFTLNIFLSYGFIDAINASTYGSKMPRANAEFISNMFLAIPPLSEQKQIINYLDIQTAKIDQAIALKTAHIEKLKEYKSVLINDVVTGKVRV